MKPNDVAIRKRTQIAKANRTMFIWVAIASVIVASAAVVCYFLGQKLAFNEKVLAEKQTTVSTLKHNVEVVPDLQDSIRVLDTNAALESIKTNPDDRAVRVILDALPADANSLALGASLQNKILTVPGIVIETLTVNPVIGVETEEVSDEAPLPEEAVDGEVTSTNVVTFTVAVKGDPAALREVLVNFERSIRTFQILSVRIETQESQQLMTIQAQAFYEPRKTIELQDKQVRP